MVNFKTKNSNLGKSLGTENNSIFYDHLEVLLPFGIMYAQFKWFAVIWYVFPVLVSLVQEKSGNPAGRGSVP
jgi:hypothetical protein